MPLFAAHLLQLPHSALAAGRYEEGEYLGLQAQGDSR